MHHPLRVVIWATLLIVSLAAESQAAPRKVLAELVTSTSCNNCYPADVYYFQNWLPNYGGADQVVTIAYHVWWPAADDPMYLANPTAISARVNYYGTNSAPNLRVDGFINATHVYGTWPGAIDPRFLDSSPISITLTGSRNGNLLDLNASIHAEVAVNSSNWRVHWVVIESGISAPQNTGSGYVPFVHECVLRDIYPDANGSPITITQGQTLNIPRSIILNSGWVANNCRVVVFVQNNTDKKVQNAEVIGVDMLTGVGGTPGGLPLTFGLDQNYPNPFNGETRIGYRVQGSGDGRWVTLRVYDMLGREVATLVNERKEPGSYSVAFDANAIPSGVYFYRLTAGGRQETRRMMLVK